MSELRIWECDRCKQSWNSNDEKVSPLRTIMVSYPDKDVYSSFPVNTRERQAIRDEWCAQWCPDCLADTGAVRTREKGEQQPDLPPPLALEDMVREIVREEMYSGRS